MNGGKIQDPRSKIQIRSRIQRLTLVARAETEALSYASHGVCINEIPLCHARFVAEKLEVCGRKLGRNDAIEPGRRVNWRMVGAFENAEAIGRYGFQRLPSGVVDIRCEFDDVRTVRHTTADNSNGCDIGVLD